MSRTDRMSLLTAALRSGLCAAALAACAEGPSEVDAGPPAPHGVVLLTIDTLRADHLPWHGYPRNTAPFLADLAARSTVFLNAMSTASHTAPSHGSMLTGLYPSQHGVTRNGGDLHEAITTLPEILGAEGYDTAAFTSVMFLDGLSAGFDGFFDPGVSEYDVRHGLASGSHRSAAETVGVAMQWLEQRSPDKPFCLWVHLFDVHEWKDQPVPDEVLDRLHAEDAVAGLSGAALVQRLVEDHALNPDWFESEKGLGEALPNIDRYDGAISVVDGAVADLFEAVSAAPGGDNVVWIIAADHGEGFTNHDLLGHSRHVYNEQLAVPLLVHGSHGRWPASRVLGTVQPIDIMPTVIELSGAALSPTTLPVGSEMLLRRSWVPLLRGDGPSAVDSSGDESGDGAPGEGQGVLPVLLDASSLGERMAFSERRPTDDHQRKNGWTGGETRVLQDGRYKLIISEESPAEFYDMQADPLELHDLADEPPFELMRYLQLLSEHDLLMGDQAAAIGAGAVNPEHLDELRRLGYVK